MNESVLLRLNKPKQEMMRDKAEAETEGPVR